MVFLLLCDHSIPISEMENLNRTAGKLPLLCGVNVVEAGSDNNVLEIVCFERM